MNLVEEQEKLRAELVQSILAYVGLASFLTFRDTKGYARYAIWFEDRHLGYILGLHSANPDLGGVEIRPAQQPSVLEECDIVWDMEMAGYGGDTLPGDTGKRSATAALGTQITDTAFRLLVCQRVERSQVINEWVKSGGKPSSIYAKAAGMVAREAADFLDTSSSSKKPKPPARKEPKKPPYTHTRILLGGNSADHLRILRDSFPAGSLRRRKVVRPEDVPMLATTAPKVPMSNSSHFPVFNDAELSILGIIPGQVTEVPMKYGRPIVTTSQPMTRFVTDILALPDESVDDGPYALFQRTNDGAVDSKPDEWVDDVPDDVGNPIVAEQFPVRMISGVPAFPVRIMASHGPDADGAERQPAG